MDVPIECKNIFDIVIKFLIMYTYNNIFFFVMLITLSCIYWRVSALYHNNFHYLADRQTCFFLHTVKAERTPSPNDMNRQECRTKRIDSVCAVIWIPLCARDGSVIKWGRGEGETLSIHVVWTRCALGLRDLSDY